MESNSILLISVDTSGKHGSVGLAQGNPDGTCDVIEVIPLAGGTFSAQLIPQIADLLSKHHLSKRDIGGFTVASGPGSFTGLRVGLAAVKALAEVTGKPIATVSLLEAVALTSANSRHALAALDAGRGEVYLGEYQRGRMIREQLVTREELAIMAGDRFMATPDHEIAQNAKIVPRPTAGAIARLGWTKILARDTVSPEALEANYIRRSDAETSAES